MRRIKVRKNKVGCSGSPQDCDTLDERTRQNEPGCDKNAPASTEKDGKRKGLRGFMEICRRPRSKARRAFRGIRRKLKKKKAVMPEGECQDNLEPERVRPDGSREPGRRFHVAGTLVASLISLKRSVTRRLKRRVSPTDFSPHVVQETKDWWKRRHTQKMHQLQRMNEMPADLKELNKSAKLAMREVWLAFSREYRRIRTRQPPSAEYTKTTVELSSPRYVYLLMSLQAYCRGYLARKRLATTLVKRKAVRRAQRHSAQRSRKTARRRSEKRRGRRNVRRKRNKAMR